MPADERDTAAEHRHRRVHAGGTLWLLIRVAAIAAVLAVGLALGLVWGERRAARQRPASSEVAGPATPSAAPAPGDPRVGTTGTETPVEITLTPEAIARAGIKTAAVGSQAMSASIVVPATVTTNAYRDTRVHALVAGIVRRVPVELGAPVTVGQPLAVIFSSELADVQMKYLAMQAMLRADHQKRERTAKLVEIGAASRQELEEVTAVHDAHETELAAARQRLLLLGLSSERIRALRDAGAVRSEVAVTAPGGGVIVTRAVNPGQVISVAQELFVVADLSTVWVIADLFEKDFGAVQVGSEGTVTVPHAPSNALRGRVAYIDPRVDPATRTAKVRVEVPNRSESLRLGMFVHVAFTVAGSGRVTLIPRSAVQSVGERSVVYVAVGRDEGRFAERAVTLGTGAGDHVQIVAGLEPGEHVVTEGTFFLRAEAAKTRAGG
jgi:membrane fusion protein, heavy metal efflux system